MSAMADYHGTAAGLADQLAQAATDLDKLPRYKALAKAVRYMFDAGDDDDLHRPCGVRRSAVDKVREALDALDGGDA